MDNTHEKDDAFAILINTPSNPGLAAMAGDPVCNAHKNGGTDLLKAAAGNH